MQLPALSAWLSLFWLLPACAASEDYFYRSAEYNRGAYGDYVAQHFITADSVEAAKPNVMLPFSACDDGSKLFVAPRGNAADSHPMIFDANGDFIWSPQESLGSVYNFQVQQYKGDSYLVYWAGDDAVKGHGAGHYYMYNKHYDFYKRISAANGLDADLHAFTITKDDTALISVYETIPADLFRVDNLRNEGFIWDCLFQEIDIETGEAVFQWRASDHVDLKESFVLINEATQQDPWDFFHINSIEKDESGNYLVSSRHLRSLLYVDAKTSKILWRLGGKLNQFQDLSNGPATQFVGQHDAHWADGHSAITLFDNRADWQDTVELNSRGTRIGVDLEKMTAKLEATYSNPYARLTSISQGSYQTLPNGNVLIGFGFNTVVTEFDKNGTVLCDVWFSPQTRFGSGDVQSYRDLKFNWTGLPRYPPSVVLRDNTFYVSWLGATEVKHWVLWDSFGDEAEFNAVLSFAKNGFETTFQLQPNQPIRQFVKVVALDREGKELGRSLTVDMGNATSVFEGDTNDDELADYETETAELESEVHDLELLLVFGFLAVISGLFIMWLSLGSKLAALRPWHAVPQREHGTSVLERSRGLWIRIVHRLQPIVDRMRQIIFGVKRHWRELLRRRKFKGRSGGEDHEILLSHTENAEFEPTAGR